MLLLNKTILITGSNGGIGRVLCKKIASNGGNIICCIRKKDNKFYKYIKILSKKYKKKIKILLFDLENEKQITKSINSLYKNNIIIDVLVNNAGTASGSLIEMTLLNDLKKIFQINFFSQIYIIQKLLKLLKKSNNPSIINICSIAGLLNHRGTVAYGSSKAALIFATKVMANEFSPYKIRVNAIAPSAVNTGMYKKMDKNSQKLLLKDSFLKKPISVEQIANKILYLASEKSLKDNGKIIIMNGDQH
jgi:3-oxoacyl-[acyl-carrier protein] reductase